MDVFSKLPDELILSVLIHLEPTAVARLQAISRRFLKLCRDNELWRIICFEHSRSEERRRREQQQASQPARLAALRAWAAHAPGPILDTSTAAEDARDEESTSQPEETVEQRRSRALTNWDPSYPTEKLDFLQEFIHRKAPITLRWLQGIYERSGTTNYNKEAVGMGVFRSGEDGAAVKVVGPLEDGSVALWDVEPGQDQNSRQGILKARSLPILAGTDSTGIPGGSSPSPVSIEPPPFDSVTVDQSSAKAFIAVYEQLHEIDLNTLAMVRKQRFPGSITALSSVRRQQPLLIGTPNKLYLHDPRAPQDFSSTSTFSERCELIAGPPTTTTRQFTGRQRARHIASAALEQPAPFSIASLPLGGWDTDQNDIWVAGSFTSLLNYDRRFWPRLRRTIFSGARLSALAAIPHPFLPRDSFSNPDPSYTTETLRVAKSAPGSTIIAVGEYKGKGSLELYGVPTSEQTSSGDSSPPRNKPKLLDLKNRQTASRTRLLSVCSHGAQLAFSDGDGGLKWVERDGFSVVREFNINDNAPPAQDAPTRLPLSIRPSHAANQQHEQDDIVQKLVPTHGSSIAHNNDDLLLWTGDGRIGLLSFGRTSQVPSTYDLEEQAENARRSEEERREREFGAVMMRELERQADETRWLRGLGLGYRR